MKISGFVVLGFEPHHLPQAFGFKDA